nr:hypothetical protein [Enterococcus plantarum]
MLLDFKESQAVCCQLLKKITSMSEITHQKKDSVYRVLKQIYEPKKINQLTLPKVLFFDVVKSIMEVTASMYFILMEDG